MKSILVFLLIGSNANELLYVLINFYLYHYIVLRIVQIECYI